MFLDLHTHSVASDDSRATVDQYIKWVNVLRRKGAEIDGFVLTEHRQFNHDIDYVSLSKKNGITILKGAELDTDAGHFLVYGITKSLSENIDFFDLSMSAEKLVKLCDNHGAIAIPAHPGRAGIGFTHYLPQRRAGFESIKVVERLNGSNRPGEGEAAQTLIDQEGYNGTGGSDAHIVSAIGSCMTKFENNITNEIELVNELRGGKFKSVNINL
ncbi:PHP domain-containing protein [Dehalococcoidia bacterium]|nr:PHP domain-containing protein [Dehalococcoidia bacterium]